MQSLGEIEHFDTSGPNTFSQWVDRFHIYCDCNAIAPEPQDAEGNFYLAPNRRRNLFLMALGPRAYATLQDLLEQVSPANRPIPILVQVLKEYYEPAGHVQANRFMFRHRLQQPNESVLEFITALTTLASSCQFTNWDDSLMDQLMVGIKHQDTRAKLIDMQNPTWLRMKNEALKDDKMRVQMRAFAQAHAQAQQRVMAVQSAQQPPPKKEAPKPQKPAPQTGATPRTGATPPSGAKSWGPCHRCGRRHDANTCPSINLECRSCKKKGHFAHRCPDKKKIPVKLVSVPPEGEDMDQLADYLLSL